MRWGVAVAVTLAVSLAGCGFFSKKPAPISAEPGATQTGIASWYGPGFHGRRTANGETYDQYALTAAHRTLPHGTRVEVTNLNNGRRVRVRINDRGPYVDDRVIDLSYTAAQRLEMIGPGTAPVRVEVIESDADDVPMAVAMPPPPRPRAPLAEMAPPFSAQPISAPLPPPVAAAPPDGAYAVHAGTYIDYDHARREQQRLGAEVSLIHLTMIDAPDARYYQLRVGPFASRDEADRTARRLNRLGVPALVVRAGFYR
ncbi:MAG: septal ring lytic transglycosylase RlpA family protein [bacterium]